ncbi:MAG: hypothetical protein IPP19_03660 [Verrucomicrobia bacterium]|nr:hypothetical protein [Verrucomicrobiota bacterium]
MKGELPSPQTHLDRTTATSGPCPTELDARASAPPILLDAILNALAAIPSGTPQFVRTRMMPSELLRALATHSVTAETTELPDGSWRTLLRRSTPSRSL